MGYLLVVCGILVHVILLYSIFDIYFTSPLVHGMTPYKTPLKPPARRVVLFVADGLRADKLFELDNDGQTRAPFLREVVMRHGAWGVSHTRVPTESRPGHVALIAGFYEDVSAVAKGWKENPVEFDSVFNESRYTWSWGSPDILPMFVTDGNRDRVFKFTYPAESEDFAGSDLFKLDTWVFSKVQEFLGTSSSDSALKSKLAGDKVVFFLHLLGIDTNGHAHRPMSQEYLNNIKIMDDGVRNTVELLENYYGHDGKTAYVLTADHGMTDWGSHGAGDPHETLTPLIVWGAGVRRPEPGMARDCDDVYSSNWGLCGVVKRHDVSQADISPLMASLIGIPWPLNSVGILPLEYLNNTLEYKAESLLSNARQILAQYEVKMVEKKATTLSAVFRPFTKLSMSAQIDKLREIRSLISSRKFTEAIHETKSIINLALEGLSYYHSYDRFFLELSITSGFLGWMSYIITLVVSEHTNMTGRRVMKAGITTKAVFYLLRASIVFLLYMQQLPWTYYMYCLLPTLLWEKVVERRHVFSCLWSHVLQRPLMVFILCVTSVMGLEILAMSFFHRELLSLGLVAMAAWPFFYTQWTRQKVAVYGWGVSCVMLAVFPLLPVVGRRANYSLVSLAGCLAIVLAVWCIRRPECHSVVQGRTKRSQLVLGLTLFQIFLLCTSVFLVLSTATSIGAKQGLPAINQYISWLTLGVSVCLPLFSESRVVTRLLNISLSLLSPYLLLSTSHEGLFYVALACLLILWLWLEHSFTRTTRKLEAADFLDSQSLFDEERHLVLADVRCCYIFVYLINTAFFGTGNIASINSFDPSTVYCFLTVFNPFVMGALMLFKVLIPFILVTCVFTAIHVTVRVPTKSLFLIVLLMSDFMGLHFFFMVQDYGSWLEIGTSISHYVIVMSMIIFIFVLLGVAHVLTTVQIQLTKSHKL